MYDVCYCLSNSYAIVSDITHGSTIGHSFKTDKIRTSLFHVTQYRDDIVGLELKLRKLPGRVVGVEPTTFWTAATDDDKD